MCLKTDHVKTKAVLKKYKPDDWLYGYKRFFINPHINEVMTPYQGTVVDLNNQRFATYSSRRTHRGKDVYNEGIHFYQHEKTYFLNTNEVLVKVYVQVKDILALGEIAVVARSIVIDKADLEMMRKKLAEKRAAWANRVSRATRCTINGYYY